MSDIIDRINEAWLEKSRAAFDCANCGCEANMMMDAVDAIESLRTEVTELREALKPFADFNDAMKEWRFGPSRYLLQTARPEDKPFLRWTEPTPPPLVPGKLKMEIRVLEVWPQDFARAERLCVSGSQK